MSEWYRDWQSREHATVFDGRSSLDVRNLMRNYEAFNDVRLLVERIDPARALSLVEVGCATGEFFRYVRVKFPKVAYYGLDVSQPALERAKAKYPAASFLRVEPGTTLAQALPAAGAPARPEIIYAKDVIQHQTGPFEFLTDLVQVTTEAVILRCRTRDVGATVLDPEQSCQYHYDGWMPYIVINTQELVEHVVRVAPRAEIVVYRNHMVLGGQHQRFVPKELYLKETGTAESALGVFLRTAHPGRVTIADRPDHAPAYTWDYTARRAVRKLVSVCVSAVHPAP